MKDDEIIRKIESGDERALEYLYAKHYSMMTRMIIKNNGSESDAKDVFQDSLIVFWQKVIKKELHLSSKISTYIYSICQNLWLKELDRRKRLDYKEEDGIENEDVLGREEQVKIIRDAVDSLGETCKNVLGMYYFDGMSMKQIADKLGFANTDTVKTKRYKCKKRLDTLIRSKYKSGDFLD
ncbi:MAG: sigma-70 family RNA polymerase sigma factor [Cyclobacteriaceae bacterium]|nr:sigma-70 family RNA polymerase sigma factor [Cyclobacteriaceae bacterium]MCH8514893.1 sigma-70 family RNA polymerase sigma factor [Cyclobacteriaceae bacterium]